MFNCPKKVRLCGDIQGDGSFKGRQNCFNCSSEGYVPIDCTHEVAFWRVARNKRLLFDALADNRPFIPITPVSLVAQVTHAVPTGQQAELALQSAQGGPPDERRVRRGDGEGRSVEVVGGEWDGAPKNGFEKTVMARFRE